MEQKIENQQAAKTFGACLASIRIKIFNIKILNANDKNQQVAKTFGACLASIRVTSQRIRETLVRLSLANSYHGGTKTNLATFDLILANSYHGQGNQNKFGNIRFFWLNLATFDFILTTFDFILAKSYHEVTKTNLATF